MKTPKSYRFSPITMLTLERLCKRLPTYTETEIVERAISEFEDMKYCDRLCETCSHYPDCDIYDEDSEDVCEEWEMKPGL